MSFEEKVHSGMYYVIPAQVFEDTDLEDSEKIFYGLLSGLAFSNGFCFASNEYLSKRKGVDERTITRWLEKLEKKGYIRRDTKKNGMYWDRKIFIMHAQVNSNNSYERKSTSVPKGHACPDRKDAHVHIESEDTPASKIPPPPPPFAAFDPEYNQPPATEEEEIEVEKRRRERPPKFPPIKNIKAWKATVLAEIRSEKDLGKQLIEVIERHKKEAEFQDGKTVNGWRIFACADRVEFTSGSMYFSVPYNYSDKQWAQAIGNLMPYKNLK